MEWRDVYQLPFSGDCGGYVFSKNSTMTLTFDNIYGVYAFQGIRSIKEDIVDKLNGDSNIKFDQTFTVRDDVKVYYGDEYVFMVRGWGKLTGVGGYNLPKDEAERIQNDFTKWILETLNN